MHVDLTAEAVFIKNDGSVKLGYFGVENMPKNLKDEEQVCGSFLSPENMKTSKANTLDMFNVSPMKTTLGDITDKSMFE